MKEDTIFKHVFGTSPKVRILDQLLWGRRMDFSLSDIARGSDVGWTTLHRVWDDFIKLEIVVHTRNIGKAKMFKLNTDNPVIKDLLTFYMTLGKDQTERYFAKLKKKRVSKHLKAKAVKVAAKKK